MAKNPWIAGILNFFFLGLGTLYNGNRKFYGIIMTIGALMFAYMEQIKMGMEHPLFVLAFFTFFVMAIACAYDGYTEVKSMT